MLRFNEAAMTRRVPTIFEVVEQAERQQQERRKGG